MSNSEIAIELEQIAAAFRRLADREAAEDSHFDSCDVQETEAWDRLERLQEQRAPWI